METAAEIAEIRKLRPRDIFADRQIEVTEAEFRARCDGQAIWHSVDLGNVFIEGARKNSTVLAREMKFMDWPDMTGKSVLDVGAFGGWFSFEAERRGAASVTAIDYYSWGYDWPRIHQWVKEEREAGRTPDTYNPPSWAFDPVGQPGRRALDVTKEILGSKVDLVLARMEDFEHDPFDVVLYLGVLYHQENPMLSMRKVASLTSELAIIETLGVHLPGNEDRPVWEFYNSDQVNNDKTTWWAPNEAGLRDLLLACGFSRVEIKAGYDQLPENRRGTRQLLRIWAHAWK